MEACEAAMQQRGGTDVAKPMKKIMQLEDQKLSLVQAHASSAATVVAEGEGTADLDAVTKATKQKILKLEETIRETLEDVHAELADL